MTRYLEAGAEGLLKPENWLGTGVIVGLHFVLGAIGIRSGQMAAEEVYVQKASTLFVEDSFTSREGIDENGPRRRVMPPTVA